MKKQLLLLFTLLVMTATTFAQRTTVKLSPAKKTPFITYENNHAIIYFNEDSFIEAANAVKRTTDDEKIFQDAVQRIRQTHKALLIHATKISTSPDEYRVFTTLITTNGIGTLLLKEGKAAVFNKKTNTAATTAEYEKDERFRYNFYFTGENNPFFEASNLEVKRMKGDNTPVPAGADVWITESFSVKDTNGGEDIFYTMEETPGYPGGEEKLKEYLTRNMKQPRQCAGSLYVYFIVEKDGTITNAVVRQGISTDCDAEAIRLINESGKWNPGKHLGKEVRSYHSVRIKF